MAWVGLGGAGWPGWAGEAADLSKFGADRLEPGLLSRPAGKEMDSIASDPGIFQDTIYKYTLGHFKS